MNMTYVLWILEALKAFDKMSGGVGTNLASVAFWSGVPRATCYRYLQKMTMLGYVRQTDGTHRKQPATMYAPTKMGLAYLKGSKHE